MRFMFLLLVLILLYGAEGPFCRAFEHTEAAQLDQEVQQLRSALKREPANPYLNLQLATTLHKLNHLKPDGGRRIAEAEKAYRLVPLFSAGPGSSIPALEVGPIYSGAKHLDRSPV